MPLPAYPSFSSTHRHRRSPSRVLESVVTDHALGAVMAVRHLVSLGHRNVGIVLAELSPTTPHIHRGWLGAAADCDVDPAAAVDVRVPDAPSPACATALDGILDRCLATGTGDSPTAGAGACRVGDAGVANYVYWPARGLPGNTGGHSVCSPPCRRRR